MAFSRFYEESYLTTVNDEEIVVELSAIYQVFVYYFAVSPTIELDASPGSVWLADESNVSAQVLCGETGFKDQELKLALADTAKGVIAPTEGISNASGMFDASYKADSSAGGLDRLTATSDWSEPVSASALTVSAQKNIEVFSLTDTWSGKGRETYSGCEDPQDNMGISGSGFWTTFSGTVSNTQPDGSFSVSGTFSDTVDGGSTGTFKGNGSAATGVLSLTWNGTSNADTCTFSGSGTATRQ